MFNVYQNLNFKIGLSLFGCTGKYTEHNTHCGMGRNSSDIDICTDGGNIALTKGLYGIEATTY